MNGDIHSSSPEPPCASAFAFPFHFRNNFFASLIPANPPRRFKNISKSSGFNLRVIEVTLAFGFEDNKERNEIGGNNASHADCFNLKESHCLRTRNWRANMYSKTCMAMFETAKTFEESVTN
jgi:hypothetical protein